MAKSPERPTTEVDKINAIRNIRITNYREAAYAIQEAAALSDRAFRFAFPAVRQEGDKAAQTEAKEALKRKQAAAAKTQEAEQIADEITQVTDEPVKDLSQVAKAEKRAKRIKAIKEATSDVQSVSAESNEIEAGVPEKQSQAEEVQNTEA